jgi:hypothetical protein
MPNFRVAWMPTVAQDIVATAENRAFFSERCYRNCAFNIGQYINHDEWWITPDAMYASDWAELSAILGLNVREWYNSWRENGAGSGRELRTADNYHLRWARAPRPKYVRHYEIEPLSLPG